MGFSKTKKTNKKPAYQKRSQAKKLDDVSKKASDIQKMIEYHYYENQPARTLTTLGNIDGLINIAEGDSSLTRTGIKITPTSVLCRIRTTAGAGSSKSSIVRYMLVRDKQQVSDTAPTPGTIVETYGLRVLSPLSRLFSGRYEVLWDKVQVISPIGHQGDVKYFSKYIKLSANKPVYFNGAGSAEIQKNGLYLLSLTDEPTNSPGMFCEFRMRYADL